MIDIQFKVLTGCEQQFEEKASKGGFEKEKMECNANGIGKGEERIYLR
jgi:hypothetical protein